MRHRRDGRSLGRTAEHRRALMRNLVTELFRHERIETSISKAKEARRVAERMITFAKKGDLSARRQVARFLFDESVTKKLFDTIAPWYAERQGGYTRIIRTRRRLGDAGEMGLFELVKSPEQIALEKKAREAAAADAKDKKKKAVKAKAKTDEEGAEAAEGAPAKKAKAAKPAKEARTKAPRDTGGKKKEQATHKKSMKKGSSKASKKG